MTHWATYKLANLNVDVRNFRIGDHDQPRDAMRAIIADQKMLLVNLAEDIMNDGLSPGEPVWVAPDPNEPGKATVIEGNRRVTALKLMENPQIAEGTVVYKRFVELAKRFAAAPIRKVDVVEFDTADEADKWLDRRHMSADSGVGLQRWRPIARNRRARARGQPTERFYAIHELLADQSDEWIELDAQLGEKWTTVDRVLGSRQMGPLLGVTINKAGDITFENGDAEAGKALLKRVLKVMAPKSFKFATIEGKDERAAFLSQFVPYAVKLPKGKAKGSPKDTPPEPPPPEEPQPGPPEDPGLKKAKPLSMDRKTLAPNVPPHILHVTGKRLGPLYKECRETEVEGHRNAAAFLLRVFIELSSEGLLAEKKVPVPKALKERVGKTGGWEARGVTLDDKIRAVIDYFDASQKDQRFQQPRLALDHKSPAYYSVKTLHGYFHNRDLVPDAQDIKGAWEAWESYLMAVHEALNTP